jgi:cerevisin
VFSDYHTNILTGLNILSTYIGGKSAVATLSGTSMASPHTAGMLAYLLSIYPSTTFNPTFGTSDFLGPTLPYASFYSLCHAALPRWMTEFLPSPELFLTAPIPGGPSEISPKELKRALLGLASKGMLSDLPSQTVNLLIFNNASSV